MMCCCTRHRTILILVTLCCLKTCVSETDTVEDPEEKLVKKVIKECTESKSRLLCFSEKAATVLERSINMDVPLFSGIKLVRNNESVALNSERSLNGFKRFQTALWNFLDTHKFTLDLTKESEAQARKSGGGSKNIVDSGGGHFHYYPEGDKNEAGEDDHSAGSIQSEGSKRKGDLVKGAHASKGLKSKGGVYGYYKGGGDGDDFGGFGDEGGSRGKGDKGMKKERKYMQYAFMVLLGIFGLTGPLFMKTLAVIAAKALIASKVALIIVGSVALKKIFEKDHHEHSSVKVHTIHTDHEDEYDRLYKDKIYKYNQILPYSAYEGYATKPSNTA